MANGRSHLTIRDSDGVTVVQFSDRKILEELSIAEIGEEFAKLIDGRSAMKLLVSFKNVDHLSSAALGMLITLNKRVSEAKGKLRLSDISPQIYEVFKITRLNRLFDIHDTADAAMSGF